MSRNIFNDQSLQKYLKEIADTPTLSREEEKELAILAKNGDQAAIKKLIESNLKFVVTIAARYQHRGLTFSELISEGNMGLIKAIEKFDPNKDIKLISYAVWWIRQRILFALAEKTSVIRIPLGKSNALAKLRSIQNKFLSETGEEPTNEELAEEINMNKTNLKKLRDKKIDMLSIDESFSGTSAGSSQLLDIISDDTLLDPKSLYYRDKTNNQIKNSIDALDERSAFIIRHYFGFGGEDKKNFTEIAELLDLSRERIRQIYKESLKKIFNDISGEINNDIDYLVAGD